MAVVTAPVGSLRCHTVLDPVSLVFRSCWTPVDRLRPQAATARAPWSRYSFSFSSALSPEGTAVDTSSPVSLQLLYLGFQRDVSEAALRLTGGDVQLATQLLLDQQGVLSPELLSESPSSEEPSTSTGRTHLTDQLA